MASTDRRPVPRKLRKDAWLKIRVSPADQAALQVQAQSNGVSVSDYVRALVGLPPLFRKVREERPPAPPAMVEAAPALDEAPTGLVAAPETDLAPAPDPEPVLSLAALMGYR